MKITTATSADHGEIFTLQRAAFVDEGRLYQSLDVPALSETLTEFKARLEQSRSWIAVEQNRIIGAVSLRTASRIANLERLMVAPDRRGEGISSTLLKVVERAAIEAGHSSLQLVVGDLALDNQQIYEHLGWRRCNSFHAEGYQHVILHHMSKDLLVVAD